MQSIICAQLANDRRSTWGAARISRIIGNEVQRPHIVIPECHAQYIAWWERLCASLLIALMLHAALLTMGFDWWFHATAARTFGFGHQQVRLASMTRRGFAAVIDLLLLAGMVGLVCQIIMPEMTRELLHPDEKQLAIALDEYEMTLYGCLSQHDYVGLIRSLVPVNDLASAIRSHREPLILIMTATLLLGAVLVWMEGRFAGRRANGCWEFARSARHCARADSHGLSPARSYTVSTFRCYRHPFPPSSAWYSLTSGSDWVTAQRKRS